MREKTEFSERTNQRRFQLNDEIYLPNCKTESVKLQEQRFVQMQACILAYHTIQRNDRTAQLNNKSKHAINPFLPFEEIKYFLMMHGLLLTHTACSYTSCILGLWAVNLVLINRE